MMYKRSKGITKDLKVYRLHIMAVSLLKTLFHKTMKSVTSFMTVLCQKWLDFHNNTGTMATICTHVTQLYAHTCNSPKLKI